MGRIVAVEYLTLDGVFEEPAWTRPYFDEAVGAFQGEAMQWADALLLGRWADGAVLAVRHDASRFPWVRNAPSVN